MATQRGSHPGGHSDGAHTTDQVAFRNPFRLASKCLWCTELVAGSKMILYRALGMKGIGQFHRGPWNWGAAGLYDTHFPPGSRGNKNGQEPQL